MTVASTTPPLTIALVAGELSGDTLGATLIRDLKTLAAQSGQSVRLIGIGGPQMQAEGLEPLGDMERLAVFGLVEVAGRLKELFALRDQLVHEFTQAGTSIFIGIDAPDFNLRLALPLRQAGIKTVQYVSPSVWAWRQGRVKAIAAAVDLVLCLFPFEPDFYAQHQVQAVYVGHPLTQQLKPQPIDASLRTRYGLAPEQPVLALLPGSRRAEVARLWPLFLEVGQALKRQLPTLQLVTAAANAARQAQLTHSIPPGLAVTVIPANNSGDSGRLAMQLADVVLLASGTASFECMLLDRPQVVAYKLNWLTYWLARFLVKTPFVALPNILAQQEIVPERIQAAASAMTLTSDLQNLLIEPQTQQQQFAQIRTQLAVRPGLAAASVWQLLMKP